MNKRSARRLGILAVLFSAALAGCGGLVAAEQAPAVEETEQELANCNPIYGPYCTSNYTCVINACRPRCDDGRTCSSGYTCCPGYYDESTGVSSAPYCATVCMG